jgi:hypothetical protein
MPNSHPPSIRPVSSAAATLTEMGLVAEVRSAKLPDASGWWSKVMQVPKRLSWHSVEQKYLDSFEDPG